MQHLFISQKIISGKEITITDGSILRHINGALRLKPGDKIVICDETGTEYSAQIESISNKTAKFMVLEVLFSDKGEENIILTVACAIPKKSKFDDIVDKLTQLGVSRIVPLLTERVIVKLDGQKGSLRRQRWEKIALSASEQSKRKSIPGIELPSNIKKVILDSSKYDLKLIPSLEGNRKSLKEALFGYTGAKPANAIVLIGPEGDFTPDEIKLAVASGFIPVSLGKEVLRVETAAVAVTSFLKLYEE